MKYCRSRRRKRYHAQQANLPRLEFGVYAIATILCFPSASSDHPILYRLSISPLLLFFYASFAIPVISDLFVGLAHFSARAATLSAAVAVASLLCIAMEAEFRWLTYLFRIFFLLFVYSLSGCWLWCHSLPSRCSFCVWDWWHCILINSLLLKKNLVLGISIFHCITVFVFILHDSAAFSSSATPWRTPFSKGDAASGRAL